jgi:type I restriction enzyme M protein
MNFPNAYAKVGDILFVRVGVGCAGRVAIVNTKEDEGIATDYIHIFKVEKINPYFLVIYLKTKYGKESIDLLKHGVGTISINKTDLLSIRIPIVSESIQEEIGNEYKAILKNWKFAILNHQDTFIYKEMTKNLTNKLEKILEESL